MTRTTQSPAASNETGDYVTVTVGQALFGLPIDRVHDVFRPTSVTPCHSRRRRWSACSTCGAAWSPPCACGAGSA